MGLSHGRKTPFQRMEVLRAAEVAEDRQPYQP